MDECTQHVISSIDQQFRYTKVVMHTFAFHTGIELTHMIATLTTHGTLEVMNVSGLIQFMMSRVVMFIIGYL